MQRVSSSPSPYIPLMNTAIGCYSVHRRNGSFAHERVFHIFLNWSLVEHLAIYAIELLLLPCTPPSHSFNSQLEPRTNTWRYSWWYATDGATLTWHSTLRAPRVSVPFTNEATASNRSQLLWKSSCRFSFGSLLHIHTSAAPSRGIKVSKAHRGKWGGEGRRDIVFHLRRNLYAVPRDGQHHQQQYTRERAWNGYN